MDAGFPQALDEVLERATAGSDVLSRAQAQLARAPTAKRVRPRAVAMFAELVGRAADARLLDDAAAIELMHTASLLHDDVVDHAQVRRGRPSANALFSDGVAVLAGDALLSRALSMMTPSLVPHALRTVSAMSIATLREFELRGDVHASLDDMMAVVDGKTAMLFSLCGRAACAHPDDDDAVRCARAALALGRIFQLRDDLDDVMAIGPERGNDVREHTPTVPLMLAATYAPSLSHQLAALWAAHEAPSDSFLDALASSRIIDETMRLAQRERAVLVDALAPYASSSVHATLLALADSLLSL